MQKSLATVVFCGTLATAMLFSGVATAHQNTPVSREAKISIQAARKHALRVFPGKIVSEELEKEPGGSGLRYSFDIRKGHVVHEVGIDAVTGKLLENSDDSNDKD